MKIFIKSLLFVMMIVCMGAIFVFSSQNSEKSNIISKSVAEKITEKAPSAAESAPQKDAVKFDRLNLIVRKYAHFTLFFALGLISSLYAAVVFKKKRTALIFTLLLCLIWASLDEIHQLYVPGRDGSVTDVLIDMSGSVLAAVIVMAVRLAVCASKKRIEKKRSAA